MDFKTNFPRYRRQVGDFLNTPLGRGFTTIFFMWFVLSGWMFLVLFFATFFLRLAGLFLIGAVANKFVVQAMVVTFSLGMGAIPWVITSEVDPAQMLEVDSLGFYVKVGYQGSTHKLRIPFPRRAENRKDVKTLIVEMLQAAKSGGN